MHAVIAVNHEKFNCRLKNLKRILNMATIGRGFSCNNLYSNGYLSLLFGDFFQRHTLPCFFLWVSCLEFRLLFEVVCFCLSSTSSKKCYFWFPSSSASEACLQFGNKVHLSLIKPSLYVLLLSAAREAYEFNCLSFHIWVCSVPNLAHIKGYEIHCNSSSVASTQTTK